MNKIFKRQRSDIPALNTASGVAIADDQKSNLIAKTLEDNFTENNKPNNLNTTTDSDITNAVESFFSLPLSTPIALTNPDEITAYISKLKVNKTANRELPHLLQPTNAAASTPTTSTSRQNHQDLSLRSHPEHPSDSDVIHLPYPNIQ
ncbi:hypothetical protein TNCV_5019971 [Trichonephila clavipes]|nr:hypothetical protein TNCV_5019971 [Trichonephila clavipes]